MGLNTRHDATKDTCTGYNITQHNSFKFEIPSRDEQAGFEAAMGLEFYKISKTIKINGRCSLKLKDRVKIFGKTYIVQTIGNSYDNGIEGMYKNDIDDFTGSKLIGLE